jgi:hypothetical protein
MSSSAYPRHLVPVGNRLIANANARLHYAFEKGSWIWCPGKGETETVVLRFKLKFTVKAAVSPLVHVTADQRFQLRLDGRDVTFGPDRSDLAHWTVQTVKVDLAPGEHELEAVCWYIQEVDGWVRGGDAGSLEKSHLPRPPQAQITWRGGFLLYGEGVEEALLSTGHAKWMVEDLTSAVKMLRPEVPHYLDVGPVFTIDLDKWNEHKPQPAATVMGPFHVNPNGVRRPGWCLFPAELPEQHRELWNGGTIRAFRASRNEASFKAEETRAPEIAAWQELVSKKKALTVPANSEVTVLWDMDTYNCGYPITETEGGKGAHIEWSWAEGLWEAPSVDKIVNQTGKGNRNEIIGKVFSGLEDGWIVGTAPKGKTPSLWWRCGRYIRVRVKTAAAPLTITGLTILTTRYPLETTASWKSSDASWDRLMPLFDRAYKIAAHETWTDTPYYEQMCYVGDNLVNAVGNYAWYRDARISRRSVEIYEWSRRNSGFVAERYPSGWRQEASTFTLFWPVMVRDYAWWRDDVAFTKQMLPGLRSVIAEFDGIVGEDGLLHDMPGWPFMDWVGGVIEGEHGVGREGWKNGCAPGVVEHDSSIANLQWVMALNAAAQVEEAYGEPLYAQRYRKVARKTMDHIVARYWDAKRGLFLNTPGTASASEHAQLFALLTGLLDAEKTKACLAALRKGDDLDKATIYFAYYALEANYRYAEADEFYRRLAFWRPLIDQGFKTTPEAPEPTRSDSHPWGAHPAYHTLASIAGVRPDAPGFAKVRIAPLLNGQEHFEAKVVHPKGLVEVTYRKGAPKSSFTISLPDGIPGELVFNGQSHALKPGKNEVSA